MKANTQDIVCDACIQGLTNYCKEGDFFLKSDTTNNLSSCNRKFEPQECQMEGCLKCIVRVSFDATCPKETNQCREPQPNYRIVTLNGQKLAVLSDFTKYDNINLKSPIPNCAALTTTEPDNLVCQTCNNGFIAVEGRCRVNDCFQKFTNCAVCPDTVKGCTECSFGFTLDATTKQCV